MQDLLKDNLNKCGGMIFCGLYFYVRCGAHILNLIVQEGLKCIEKEIACVRERIKYVTGSEARWIKFQGCSRRASCDCALGLWLDCPTRWNSTFIMLERALFYRGAFKKLSDTDKNFIWSITDYDWDLVSSICDLLKPFKAITDLFSGTQYPTANLYFIHIWRIHLNLCEGERSSIEAIKNMSSSMIDKFDKYWDSYSTILSFAAILDPLYKMKFVKYGYDKLYGDEIIVKAYC